jgi:hypothetical protein
MAGAREFDRAHMPDRTANEAEHDATVARGATEAEGLLFRATGRFNRWCPRSTISALIAGLSSPAAARPRARMRPSAWRNGSGP